MWEICGDFSALVDRSPKNYFPGLLCAYTFEIIRSLLPRQMCAVRKRPWLSESTDRTSQGRFLSSMHRFWDPNKAQITASWSVLQVFQLLAYILFVLSCVYSVAWAWYSSYFIVEILFSASLGRVAFSPSSFFTSNIPAFTTFSTVAVIMGWEEQQQPVLCAPCCCFW